jgi:hypothetical protein
MHCKIKLRFWLAIHFINLINFWNVEHTVTVHFISLILSKLSLSLHFLCIFLQRVNPLSSHSKVLILQKNAIYPYGSAGLDHAVNDKKK